MKKIVALVLSLVMVLGLATTAMAAGTATAIVGDYEFALTTDTTATRYDIDAFNKVSSVTPVDKNENGIYDEVGDVQGEIAYYTVFSGAYSGGTWNYVQVNTIDDADVIVYVEGALVPYMYLAALPNNTPVYKTGAVEFKDFGTSCGQFKYVDYDAAETYYVLGDDVYVADIFGAENLMVGGKFVQATKITASGKWVAHTPVYAQNDKGVVTGVTCAKCTDIGVIVANYAALPLDVKLAKTATLLPGSNSKYFYWVETAETPVVDTDKVESAQTFDAGIAMYVGMSVMAAAGSAVVLKKKD